jgi:hypothetical protein
MATSKRKARVVSSKQLSAAIEDAVAMAAERANIKVKDILGVGNIRGVRLRLNAAGKSIAFAETAARRVSKLTGISAVPAVAKVRRGLIAGFFQK